MAAAKGTLPPGGSRKGIPNKLTADLKAMILGALDDAGGRDYLRQQAHENPAAFLTLLGKTLPKDVTIESTVNINDERAATEALIRELSEEAAAPGTADKGRKSPVVH